jgi:hypothetical protein
LPICFPAQAKSTSWAWLGLPIAQYGIMPAKTTLFWFRSMFADRATLVGPPPKVVWLRCGNQSTEFIERLLRDHVEAIAAFESGTTACLEIY